MTTAVLSRVKRAARWRWLCSSVLAVVVAACDATPPDEIGFAGLGEQASAGFRQPAPGDVVTLPQDLGTHPDYRIEWWYLTANLNTADGTPLGLQWTQFRQGLKPGNPDHSNNPTGHWSTDAVWMSHVALSFEQQHWFAERLARGGTGQAGATAQPFSVWLDDWLLDSADTGDNLWRLTVRQDSWGYDLTIRPQRDIVRHGQDGFSIKSASGQGSMYFSYVNLAIEGEVYMDGNTFAVTGQGWFDREWSSQFLKTNQTGWDWMALHLTNGDKLMAFRLREDSSDFYSATWVDAEGAHQTLAPSQFTLEAVRQRHTDAATIPDQWQLKIPAKALDITIVVPPGDYWNKGLFPYWESPVAVTGSHTGVGYVELTGYQD